MGLGAGLGSWCSWLSLNVVAVLAQAYPAVVSCSAELNTLSSLLARLLAAPTPSWLAWPVFVIVALAPGQAWLGASLVGTVCTVSAEPSLSSYTINFFFFLIW